MLMFFVNPIVREAPSRISTGVAKSSLPDLRNSIFSFAAELRFISRKHCQMGLTSFCFAHFFEMFSPQLRRASSLPHLLLKRLDLLLLGRYLCIFIFQLGVQLLDIVLQLLIQPLDRGESYAAFVNFGDVLVVFSDLEGGMEILRHRPDVADGSGLRFVVPGGDRHGQHLRQNLSAINRREIGFHVAVAERGPRSTASGYADAGGEIRFGVEDDAAGGAGEKLVVSTRGYEGLSGVVTPQENTGEAAVTCILSRSKAADAGNGVVLTPSHS